MKSSSVTKPDTFPKSTGPQRSYLRERLSSTGYPRYRHDREGEPADIKAARKKIEAYEKARRAKASQETSAFERAKEKAKEAIMFGSADEALKLIVAYEKMVEATRG